MGKYLLIKKHNIIYIDILTRLLPSYNIELKHNLIGLNINTDILIIIDVKILGLALKLKFKNIYYLNIEQLTIPLDNLSDDLSSDIAKRVNKNIFIQYFKLQTLYKKSYKLLDYSNENNKIWNSTFNNNSNYIIEPYYPLQDSIDIKNKTIDVLTLINHMYRPNFVINNLKPLKNKLINFLGKYGDNRRNMLVKSKILINIHAGINYRIGELFRLYEALAHKVIIISQHCYDNDLITLKDYIIFVDDDKMLDKYYDVIKNYEMYYNKFFTGESLSRLNLLLENINQKNKTIFDKL
jgi:hypothetical protein